MEHYMIKKVFGTPDWNSIEKASLNNIQWLPDTGIRMYAQIAYDEDRLYVHLRAIEKDIRAECTTQNCMICKDSCMEFFFRPEENDGRYMNFEGNLNGQFYIGVGHDRSDSTRVVPDADKEKELLQAKGNRTEDGWELFYQIPVAFLRAFFPECRFYSGKKIYANLYKCGDLTVQRHYITWNKVELEKPDYHRPEFFGEMTLE